MRGIRKRKFSENVDETVHATTGLSTFAEFAHNQSDVEQILKADSVRHVVVEKNMAVHSSSQNALRDLLNHSGTYNRHQPHPASGKRSSGPLPFLGLTGDFW